MNWLPITSPAGVLATLSTVCALFFWLEKRAQWRFFQYLPALVFIYLVPLILANAATIPLLRRITNHRDILSSQSPVYDGMQSFMLPMMLVLLLLNVNVAGAVRVMGRGIGVMLFGTLGVVLGAPIGMLCVRQWLGPDAWKSFGTLAGSWIGGTANMAAVKEMIGASSTEAGLAILADSTISYPIWLPILLASKRFASRFAAFTGVEADRMERMRQVAEAQQREQRAPAARDYIFLFAVALLATWAADLLATWLAHETAILIPAAKSYLTASTWRILAITTIGIGLSFTPLSRIPGSQELGMAFVFLFVAQMGATANLEGVAAQAVPFFIGALIWIFIHGAFCVLGAKLLRTDLHTAAIASAANIGGPASATIVATYHEPALVPTAILMALIGYAVGNYCGYLAALLCRLVSG